MISEILDKKSLFNQTPKNDIDYLKWLSKIVIPFSKFFSNHQKPDIYSGNEKKPFKERDSEYKSILIREFLK